MSIDIDPDAITADDLGSFIEAAAAQAAADGDTPTPLVAGTFVMYPMPDGGVLAVTNVADGPMAGEKRIRIRPGMIRAVGLLSGGGKGSKMAALKALAGRKRVEQP